MNSSYDKSSAVVVLPPVGGGRLRDPGLKSWLARSDLVRQERRPELLTFILSEIGKPCPEDGYAALRIWGQTGDRPTAWIAAVDPVYLEPRLDHLCLHAFSPYDIVPAELRQLIDHLQVALGGESGFGFARIGGHVYLSAAEPIASAAMPAYAIHGREPGELLPAGEGEQAHRGLLSEVEMALHEHAVNIEREAAGKRPVNSMWIWGGGFAPEGTTEWHPPLFADDALLAGYWTSKTAVVETWPGTIDRCLDESLAGFVAVTPDYDDDIDLLEAWLTELQGALKSGRLSSLVLLFRDGIRADIHPRHAYRFWRRRNTLLEEPPAA